MSLQYFLVFNSWAGQYGSVYSLGGIFFPVFTFWGLYHGSFKSSLWNMLCLGENIATVIFQYSIVKWLRIWNIAWAFGRSLGLLPLDFTLAQAIVHRISLLSSKYRYNLITALSGTSLFGPQLRAGTQFIVDSNLKMKNDKFSTPKMSQRKFTTLFYFHSVWPLIEVDNINHLLTFVKCAFIKLNSHICIIGLI